MIPVNGYFTRRDCAVGGLGVAAAMLLPTGDVAARGRPCNVPNHPDRRHFRSALGVIKGELIDVSSGPHWTDIILEFRTLETYKGPRYPGWDVLWRHGVRDVYEEGRHYVVPIFRIGPDLRGNPDYDFYGELPAGNCGDRIRLFEWTPHVEADVLRWLKE